MSVADGWDERYVEGDDDDAPAAGRVEVAPDVAANNARLTAENAALRVENAQLRGSLSPDEQANLNHAIASARDAGELQRALQAAGGSVYAE